MFITPSPLNKIKIKQFLIISIKSCVFKLCCIKFHNSTIKSGPWTWLPSFKFDFLVDFQHESFSLKVSGYSKFCECLKNADVHHGLSHLRNRLKCYTLSNILSYTFVQSDTILDSSALLLSRILSKLGIRNQLTMNFVDVLTFYPENDELGYANTHNLLRMRYHQKHTKKWTESYIREYSKWPREL